MAPGPYIFANEGIWSAAFRIQRNHCIGCRIY
jgi:hypothetical protein